MHKLWKWCEQIEYTAITAVWNFCVKLFYSFKAVNSTLSINSLFAYHTQGFTHTLPRYLSLLSREFCPLYTAPITTNTK